MADWAPIAELKFGPVRTSSCRSTTGADLVTEARWGDDARSPSIDWRMSAALENVPRGDSDVAEVTSLANAVRAWQELDAPHHATPS